MKTALGLLSAILVIATVSNPGLANPGLCCRLRLPCCNGIRVEREPSATDGYRISEGQYSPKCGKLHKTRIIMLQFF